MKDTDIDIVTHVPRKVFLSWITAVVLGVTAAAGSFMVFAFNTWADSHAKEIAQIAVTKAVGDHVKMEAHEENNQMTEQQIAVAAADRIRIEQKVDAIDQRIEQHLDSLEKQLDRIYDEVKE